jgi:Tol biopolymer transport system component
MIRRLAGVAVVGYVLLALPAVAQAEVPAGPRLTFVEAADSGFKLISSDPSGGDRRVILGGNDKSRLLPFPFSSIAWSSDGTRVAFSGIERSGNEALLDIYDAAADGTGVTKLPGTSDGLDAVLSPDGRTLAFAREREREGRRPHRGKATVFRSVSIWLLDIDSGTVSQLTPWRNGLFAFPSSFSPDRSTLAITRERRHRTSAVAVRLDGSGETVLARNARDPVYSPDGTRVALVTLGKRRTIGSKGETLTYSPTELAVAAADGSGLTKLTQTPNLELLPSWDPSGRRLAYILLSPVLGEATALGIGDSIMEINADGSCRTKVLSVPNASLYGAAWQPGPGREAGPIAC